MTRRLITNSPVLLPVVLLAPLLSGCIARSALDLASAPVRAGGRVVDTTADAYDRLTVSDSERDQRRGRQIRQREERLGRLERDYGRARAACDRGSDEACRDAVRLRDAMDDLSPQVPYERR